MTAHRPASWRDHRPADAPPIPQALEALLDSGAPILGIGRSSLEYSEYRLAVADFLDGLDVLKVHTGLDLGRFFDQEDLERRLAAAPTTRHDGRVGRRFSARFLLIERPDLQFVGLIAMASASRLTDDLEQPVAERLAEEVRRRHPAVLLSDQGPRIVRGAWARARVQLELEEVGTWLLSAMRGLQPTAGDAAALGAFLDGRTGGEYSKSTPDNARAGQRRLSDKVMIDGCVRVHASVNPPPGFAYVTMREPGADGLRPKLLFLDTPSCRPPAEEIASGGSKVVDAHGEPVCQVDNVRWALANLGKLTPREFNRGLKERRYSTQRLRDRNTTSTHAGEATHVNAMFQAFVHNLALYEAGVLTVDLGRGAPVTVTECWPHDGEPWASPEDFDRIRQWVADRPKFKKRSFSHAPISVDGVAGVLVPTFEEDELEECDFWVKLDVAGPSKVRLTHIELAETVVEALRELGAPREPVAPGSDDAKSMKYARELEQGRTRIKALQDATAAEYARVETVDVCGVLALSAEQIQAAFERIAELEAASAALEANLAEVSRRASRRLRRLRDVPVPMGEVLHLAAALRDPTSVRVRKAVHSGAIRLALTLTGRHVLLSAEVRVDTPHGLLVASSTRDLDPTGERAEKVELFSRGIWPRGPEPRGDHEWNEFFTERLALLGEGVPFWSRPCPSQQAVLRRFASWLTDHPAGLKLLNITDPRLTRIVAHALFISAELSDAQLAERLGEPTALITRLRQIHDPSVGRLSRWTAPTRTLTLVAMHVLAARSGGRGSLRESAALVALPEPISRTQFGYNRPSWVKEPYPHYTIPPCRACGSWRLGPSLLREVDEVVCLDCQVDRSGIVWPSAPYDGYLAHPHLWIEAGLLGSIPRVPIYPDRSVHRSLPNLPPETIAAVRADAAAGARRTSKAGLGARYGLTLPMVDAILEGEPLQPLDVDQHMNATPGSHSSPSWGSSPRHVNTLRDRRNRPDGGTP